MASEDRDSGTRGRVFPVLLGALAFFGVLGMLPTILPALHLHLRPTAPTTSYGVTLMVAPRNPHAVHVPQVATPVDPGSQWATAPTANETRESATVAAEDKRLRTLLHDAARIYQPEVIPVRGSLPTLVLTAGQGAYTAQSLIQYGALVMLPHNAALLLDNVYVSSNATLNLGGPSLRTLYLDSGSGGFTSIVGWGGNLSFRGTAAAPMTILGWDRNSSAPAADTGYGRPYIREAGGRLTLSDVRASSLGFWSGRTGGVAWTGLTGKPSTGGATSSTFTANTYGAFVSRTNGVTFRDDLFEFNQLDGMHVHRYAVGTAVMSSSAARNGGNGFVVSPATQNTLLKADISEHNADNGFFLNGKPLATGASASGGSVAPGANTAVEYSAALNNGKIGILAEGGTGTVLKGDQVCASITAVSLRDGSTDAVVTGNTIRCGPRSGFSVGPATPGLVLSGNAVDGARTGFLIKDSGPVHLDRNLVTRATVFGVSARGSSSAVSGVDNTISGTGFRAIDARALAPTPSLYNTNLAGWAFHAKVTVWSYLQFHPLAAMWIGILVLVLLAWVFTRRHRAPSHPYPASTRWRGEAEPAQPAAAALAASTATPVTAASAAMVAAQASDRFAAYRAASQVPAFDAAASPAADGAYSRVPVPADPVGLGAAGNLAGQAGRYGRYETAAAFEDPASRSAPVWPERSPRHWDPVSRGPAGSAPAFGLGSYPETGTPDVTAPDVTAPDVTAPDSGVPLFESHGPSFGAPSQAAAESPSWGADSGARGAGAARPPWSTAPMPELDPEAQRKDKFDPYHPWSREAGPQ